MSRKTNQPQQPDAPEPGCFSGIVAGILALVIGIVMGLVLSIGAAHALPSLIRP